MKRVKTEHFLMKLITIIIILFYSLMFVLPCYADTLHSEVISINTKDNELLINVAKKYPSVRFFTFENPPKILIDLLETKYHKSFKDDSEVKKIKNELLKNLSFVQGVTYGIAKYDDKTKLQIIMKLKSGEKIKPKLLATKDNIIKISFIPDSTIVTPQETPSITYSNVTELYNNAVEEHIKGNLDQAEKLYKDVLTEDANNFLARYNLGKLYLDKQQYADSIGVLFSLYTDLSNSSDSTLQKKNNLLLINKALGIGHYLNNDFEHALNRFQEILNLDNANYDAYYYLGLIEENFKNLKKAKEYFKKAVDLKLDFTDAYYHIGVLNLIENDKKDAVLAFKKVLELAPDSRFGQFSQNELKKLEK